MALTSGFLISAFLESCKTVGVLKASSENDRVMIPLSAFSDGDFKLARVRNFDYDLAIQKKADGTFETLVLMCTHAGQPLTRTGQNYYCTLHGSIFDHEGRVTKGPASRDLRKLPTTIEDNNLIIHLKA